MGIEVILETAKIKVATENRADFETALAKAVSDVLSKSPGFVKFEFLTGVEESDTYLLHIYWNTLEDHTVGFRESDLFTQWRGLIGPFFAAVPEVTHWQVN